MVSPYLLKPLRSEAQALRDIEGSGACRRPPARARAAPPVRRATEAAARTATAGPAQVLVRALTSHGREPVPASKAEDERKAA